ncbi:hypothetical protein LI037_26355, partial [Bacteroides xylanisolvens]|uniref:hypothetical protein n=1 Tax=Bacteroides xylanisolvens TaxID=371601 RepID=UPI001D091C13
MKHILPSFGLGKGGYFAVRYFLASTPKSSKKRLELLVIPLICVHAVFFPTLPFIGMTVLISGLPVVIRYAADYGQTRKEKF